MSYTIQSFSDVVSETPQNSDYDFLNGYYRKYAHAPTSDILIEIEQLLVGFEDSEEHEDRNADLYLDDVENLLELLQYRHKQKFRRI